LGMSAAQKLAARRAIEGLGLTPDQVLVDGNWDFVGMGCTRRIVKGDRTCLSISTASVLAKVTRDRIMGEIHERMPWYGFGEHKGYCTPEHNASLLAHGPSAEHRFSYVNVVLAARMHGITAPPRNAPRARLWPMVPPVVVQNGVLPRAGEVSTR